MALAHIFRLLKKFFRDLADGVHEAHELRRTMSRRHPHMED